MFAHTSDIERKATYGFVCFGVLAACLWLVVREPILFPLDDAYITLHNASVLVSGSNVNYVGTPALTGATSPVHLALVTVLSILLPLPTAAYISGTLGMCAYALGLARLAFTLGSTPLLAVAAVSIGMLSGYAPLHLFNGLETGLAMAAATWALLLAQSRIPSWHLPVLCGVMPFIRPELSALSILLMVRHIWPHARERDAIRKVTSDLALTLLAALPWLLWMNWNIGHVVPDTISAKSAFFAEGSDPAQIKVSAILLAINLMTFTTVGLGLALAPRTGLEFIAFSFPIIFLAAYYIHFPGALYHNDFRYLQIVAPVSVFTLLSHARSRTYARHLLVLALVLLIFSLPRSLAAFTDGRKQTAEELAAIADWARATLPDDARILVHDAGYFAYATRFELIDLVGLKTPGSVPFHERLTAPTGGEARHEAIHQIALEFKPTHAVILNDAENLWGASEDALRRHGWTLETLRPAKAYGNYAVFKLTPPSGH